MVDLLWIGIVAFGIYRDEIGHLLRIVDKRMVVNVSAALATWAIIVTGVRLCVR